MNLTREMVRSLADQWVEAVNAHDIEKVVSLYSDDAVLWGTFARSRRTEKSCLKEYFAKLFAKPGLKAEFTEQHIRLDGKYAFNSGSYIFSWMESGKEVIIPARFSMAYRLAAAGPEIADHHSSLFPPENFDPRLFLKMEK